jgi:hypothetical protein
MGGEAVISVKIVDNDGRKLEFMAVGSVIHGGGRGDIEIHLDGSVNDLLPDPVKYAPPKQSDLALLCANLAEEPWLSMNALADKLAEEGRDLEAEGFRFLIKGKHIPLHEHRHQGRTVLVLETTWQCRDRNGSQVEGRGYGHILPRMVYLRATGSQKVKRIRPDTSGA